MSAERQSTTEQDEINQAALLTNTSAIYQLEDTSAEGLSDSEI